MRCDIRKLSDGAVCFTCGNALPSRFGKMGVCKSARAPNGLTGWRPRLEDVVGAVLGVALLMLLLWAGRDIYLIPTVYESYTTGECVRVEDPAGVYTCENMPYKFNHRWTQ